MMPEQRPDHPGPSAPPTESDDTEHGERVGEIISEFSAILAFARNRWSRYAQDVDNELSGASMVVLQAVRRMGRVAATEIGRLLDMDKSVVSRQITKLRDLGLVAAEPAAEDRRVLLLTVTEYGESQLESIRHRWVHDYHERFVGWTVDDLTRLRDDLHRFNATAHPVSGSGPAARCGRGAAE